MTRYEYKVVPAPRKGQRGKGVRGTEGKFANALQLLMNEYGAEGWDYQRTDTLPCEERSGLTGRTTTYQNMLVFRRPLPEKAPAEPLKLIERQVEPDTADASAAPERIAPVNEGKAPRLGAVGKGDPGKTASAPDVTVR